MPVLLKVKGSIPDWLSPQTDAQTAQLLGCDGVVHDLLHIPLRSALLLCAVQDAAWPITMRQLRILASLFSFELSESILMNQGPFFRCRVCQHLPLRLFWKILPAALVHQLEEELIDDTIIFWPCQVLGRIQRRRR